MPSGSASLLSLFRSLVRRDVLGVFYHAAAAEPLPHIDPIYPHRPADLFEQDLEFIKEYLHPVSSETVHALRLEGKPPVPNSVHLSFDDGFRECFTVASPMLQQYKIPATFFIPTDYIDNRRMYYRNKAALCIDHVKDLTGDQVQGLLLKIETRFGVVIHDLPALNNWILSIQDEDQINALCEACEVDWLDYLQTRQPYLTTGQIKELATEGFTIGAHSRRHIKLNRLSQEELEAEIVGSCEVIRAITGSSPVPFSFPNSGAGLNRELLGRIRRQNPHVGLYYDTKGVHRDRKFIVNRVWIEAPRYNPGGTASLSQILTRAYQSYLIETITRKRRPA